MNKPLAAMAVAALVTLAGCETPTPYQAAAPGAQTGGGYSETRLEQDRWRVEFKGNTETPRETVETYLLYRAAELTAAQGYDWFEAVERKTDSKDEVLFTGGPWGYGPSWRFYGGWGPRRWGPPYGDPFWDAQTIREFDATAEIVMGHGPKPPGDKHAYDAHDVLSSLAGKIVKPSTK